MKGYLRGVIAQLVERVVRNDEVWSSILHGSTTLFNIACQPKPYSSEKTLQQGEMLYNHEIKSRFHMNSGLK